MRRVAAIDCGTNSIRLLIADVSGRGLRDVARCMEIVRLGEGVDRTGRLSSEALERTRLALKSYAGRIAESDVERVRMVATSATRDASNAADFRSMVVSTLGVEPVVVSGDEEARLSFDGAVRGLPPDDYLVVDIGGGSTEFVTAGSAVSVDIGCVRMTERHLHSDPPTSGEVAEATVDIGASVDRALGVVGPKHGTLVGLAGSVTTVAGIALGLPRYDSERIHHARVSYADVARVTADLLRQTREGRRGLPVMHPGRADVIGAGALILRIVMEKTGAPDVLASEHDILDGICYAVAAAI